MLKYIIVIYRLKRKIKSVCFSCWVPKEKSLGKESKLFKTNCFNFKVRFQVPELCFLNYARRHYIIQQPERDSCRTLLFPTEITREFLLLHFHALPLCSSSLQSLNKLRSKSCCPQTCNGREGAQHREGEALGCSICHSQNHTAFPACSPSLGKRGGKGNEGNHAYTALSLSHGLLDLKCLLYLPPPRKSVCVRVRVRRKRRWLIAFYHCPLLTEYTCLLHLT